MTYRLNDQLARTASRTWAQSNIECRLAPYVFMTKPEIYGLLSRVHNVPQGGAVIYRHFAEANRESMARKMRTITTKNGVQLLIGKDAELAELVGADGVHLPERDLGRAAALREKHPHWILSGAVHNFDIIDEYSALDAVIYAKVSICRQRAFTNGIKGKTMPVIALGGINRASAHEFIYSGAAGLAGSSGFALGFQPYVQRAARSMAEHMATLHALCFDKPWPAGDFTAHIENNMDTVLVIENEPQRDGFGAVLGFIIIRTQEGQAEVLTIAVHPKLHASGLGTALLEMGMKTIVWRNYQTKEKLMSPAEILFLEVAKDNESAISLYKNFGFAHCGTRPGYYRRAKGRVDALLFQKHLP